MKITPSEMQTHHISDGASVHLAVAPRRVDRHIHAGQRVTLAGWTWPGGKINGTWRVYSVFPPTEFYVQDSLGLGCISLVLCSSAGETVLPDNVCPMEGSHPTVVGTIAISGARA